MKYKIFLYVLLALLYAGCSNNHDPESDTHEHEQAIHEESDHDHEGVEKEINKDNQKNEEPGHEDCDHDHEGVEKEIVEDGHQHEEAEIEKSDDGHQHGNAEVEKSDDGHQHGEAEIEKSDDGHQDEEVKIQLTAYSADFELFAEADPFVVGESSNVLSHFSNLPGFGALESGQVTIRLVVNGAETRETLDKPTRKGIYSFDIEPENEGLGVLIFDIITDQGTFELSAPGVMVYGGEEEAHAAIDAEAVASGVNTFVFTKEQSWKIDFATEPPNQEPFGQVIKTTAQVQSAQRDEILVSAKTNGIVMFRADNILEGLCVSSGQVLFLISGSGFADNNSEVRFMEAQNNFEKAKSEYLRIKELAQEKIVSEKDLLNAKNQYDNAKLIYDNLNKNFSSTGQNVASPMSGFVKQLFVQNGQYVESGQALVSISQNKSLLLTAEVQQKYASSLGAIKSANIHTMYDDQTFTLEQLNGKVLSYGKNTSHDNYLIPVNLLIDNNGSFFPGGFVEVYLKTITNTRALTLPNSALLEEQGNYFVFAQITPELFEKREVKPGATDGLKTEILKGLAQNDRIVTRGAVLIKLAQATGTLDAHSGHVH
nr:efflux RND transporter periplasmic adaptor subunit [Bacteroidota bacterium]